MFLFSCASITGYNASDSEVQLSQAILRNDVATVKSLLAGGASPDSRMPSSGDYVLSIALDRNDIAMAKLLFDAGASANAKDRSGQPVLFIAKKAPMIRLMLEHGADMYAPYNNKTAYEYFATREITTYAEKQAILPQSVGNCSAQYAAKYNQAL
jgi:hypothetical protein